MEVTTMTWWERLFYGFNTTAKVTEDDPFIDNLKEKGFHYNDDENRWERTWLVATKTGAESSKEVYIKEDNNWKVVMYGNDGDIFFEHTVNPTEST